MPDKTPKIALIDAHALIHRAYHALPPMTAKDGRPTNAGYGFTLMLLKMLSTVKPTHVVAAFDLKGPTFRHKEFKDYKAQRKPADDELVSQFDLVRDTVKAFNIPIVTKKSYEADDIIGTLSKKIGDKAKKVIVTGDKDTLQLIDDSTFVFTLKRGMSDTVLYNKQMVQEQYGFTPELIADFKGLCGDPSDNIPGVQGIGEKTAKDLVSQYGDLENIYNHLESLPARAQKHLRDKKEDALFSKKIATIECSVPIDFDLKEAKMDDFDPEKVRAVFIDLGFNSLISRIPKSTTAQLQPTLFSEQNSQECPDNYHLVETDRKKKELIARLKQEKVIGFDTETDSLGAAKFPIVGMSFAAPKGDKTEAWYVPVDPKSVKQFEDILSDKNVGKVGQNLKYDYEVLAQSDMELKPIVFDTKIASYLLSPGSRQHSLDSLAAEELGHNNISITSLIGKGANQIKMSEVPLEKVVPYACEDADIAFQLYRILQKKIKDAGLTRVFEELELPLIPVLAKIEMAGAKLDQTILEDLRQKIEKKINHLQEKIWQTVGEKFNINSTQQLRKILYEKLELPTEGITRTQSGYSTAAPELEKLREEHEIIAWLEDYRELSKLLNTYIKTLPELVNEKTGRVYTSFHQTVTATGRLSSSDPNLQNIPIRTDIGREIRGAFTCEEGNSLVKADYSQLELRVAAHLSGDEKMIDAFRNDEDIHRSTAAWVNDVQASQVTPEMRRAAKSLNFGVLYGMGAQKFSREANVSMEEARSFIERYKSEYSGITDSIEATIKQAQEMGYVETILGRRRYLPEINSRTPSIRAAAERAAFNFPVQGTAADILKKAMIKLSACLEEQFENTSIILTVHDELVCEVPSEHAEQLGETMKKTMQNVYTLDVPLITEVAIGQNWKDMKKI